MARIQASVERAATLETAVAKIKNLLGQLDECLLERENHVRMALLSVIAGHHALFLGPPGTAKSLLARSVCKCIEGAGYFEYLLSKFTHPDELFGPVSIPGLKEEDYRRLIEGYLPDAHIAFLDEIFKANSAILNSLLTIINERIFHHGKHRDRVPLLGMIGASNEPPDPEGGLGALYDRFLVRMSVPPLADEENFIKVSLGEIDDFNPAEHERLTLSEMDALKEASKGVKGDEYVRRAIASIRTGLDELNVEASDRRWKWALELLKVSAISCGRDSLSPVDILLLENCFGDPPGDVSKIRKVVLESIQTDEVINTYSEQLERRWLAIPKMTCKGLSLAQAKRDVLTHLDEFREQLELASGCLDQQLDTVKQQVETSPWLTAAIPGELVAGFVGPRKRIDSISESEKSYRSEVEDFNPLQVPPKFSAENNFHSRNKGWDPNELIGDHTESGAVVWVSGLLDEPLAPLSEKGELLDAKTCKNETQNLLVRLRDLYRGFDDVQMTWKDLVWKADLADEAIFQELDRVWPESQISQKSVSLILESRSFIQELMTRGSQIADGLVDSLLAFYSRSPHSFANETPAQRESMTDEKLKKICKTLRLPDSGTRADLIQRIDPKSFVEGSLRAQKPTGNHKPADLLWSILFLVTPNRPISRDPDMPKIYHEDPETYIDLPAPNITVAARGLNAFIKNLRSSKIVTYPIKPEIDN